MDPADCFVVVTQLARKLFPPGTPDYAAKELALYLDLPAVDDKWVTPEGRDVTHLCESSDEGGFSGKWSLQGWVLDELSMTALRAEFPADFR